MQDDTLRMQIAHRVAVAYGPKQAKAWHTNFSKYVVIADKSIE